MVPVFYVGGQTSPLPELANQDAKIQERLAYAFKTNGVKRVYSYNADANLNGGVRAFVVTGLYEKVLPMDIYPVFLLKAILAENIEEMERLGIFEVVEEDLALCEYVCPSKIDVQEIVAKGIDIMIKDME